MDDGNRKDSEEFSGLIIAFWSDDSCVLLASAASWRLTKYFL